LQGCNLLRITDGREASNLEVAMSLRVRLPRVPAVVGAGTHDPVHPGRSAARVGARWAR